MVHDNIKYLAEKFSSELVLIDSKDLSGLLPILKQLHIKYMRLSLQSEAKEIRQARNSINESIKNNQTNVAVQIFFLETFISDLIMPIKN